MTTQTVLVTGANSGIGLATAIELAKAGYHTVGTVRSAAKAETVAQAAAEAEVAVETVLLDVTDAEACADVFAGRRFYAIVNNAGYGLTAAIEDVDDDAARHILETMVVAPMRLARLALPAMREHGGGRIVNISSIYGRVTGPMTGWYQAAKHALEAVSDALRIEVAGDGVKVVLVEPGGFRTAIWEDLERDVDTHAHSRFAGAYRRTQQVTRLSEPIMGDPQQCAKVIVGAIRSSRPRSRYLVGLDAQALVLADSWTPTAIKDRVLRLTLGL